MIEEYVKQYAEREREIKQQASNKIIPRKCINCVNDVTQSQMGYFNSRCSCTTKHLFEVEDKDWFLPELEFCSRGKLARNEEETKNNQGSTVKRS